MKQINKNIALRGPTCVAKQPRRRASRSFDLIDKIKCDQPRHVSRDVMNVWNQDTRGIVYGERFCGGNCLDGFDGLKALQIQHGILGREFNQREEHWLARGFRQFSKLRSTSSTIHASMHLKAKPAWCSKTRNFVSEAKLSELYFLSLSRYPRARRHKTSSVLGHQTPIATAARSFSLTFLQSAVMIKQWALEWNSWQFY